MERDFYCRDSPSSVAVPLKFEEPPVISSLEAHCPEVAPVCLDFRHIGEEKGAQ